jgi:hypothetical protein
MNIGAGYLSLQAGLKELRRKWEEVQLYWDDAVRREFAEQVWMPLETQVMMTLRAMDQLIQTFQQAESECC